MDKITVYITTYQVPFDQVVEEVRQFDDPFTAVAFINEKSSAWWAAHRGNASVAEEKRELGVSSEPFEGDYEPITELAYDTARYVLWGGENVFHAMLDKASHDRLLAEYYQRNYTDKGQDVPGYMQVAMGTISEPDYLNAVDFIHAFYGKPKY